ncbi:MAG: hypothetical protein O2887_08540 [Bacteroidetes bacterium]|nr:hypothetical protein [Bacteroidota bacterium]MDA1120526.1 hypothetical protein [Bacteroidota bacterium]
MLRFKKIFAIAVILTLFSTGMIISCGQQGSKEEEKTEESAEHP